jgi:hypothetical protein
MARLVPGAARGEKLQQNQNDRKRVPGHADGNGLAILVSLELREREPARDCHRVFVLLRHRHVDRNGEQHGHKRPGSDVFDVFLVHLPPGMRNFRCPKVKVEKRRLTITNAPGSSQHHATQHTTWQAAVQCRGRASRC